MAIKKRKGIPLDLQAEAFRILRRSELYGEVQPGEWENAKGMDMSARRYVVKLLSDEGMKHRDIAQLLSIPLRMVDLDIARTLAEAVRGLPPNWAMAQLFAVMQRLEILAQKSYADSERAETDVMRGVFRRLAIDATEKRGALLVKAVNGPDLMFNFLKGKDANLTRESLMQQVYEKRLQEMNGNGKEPMEMAQIAGPVNGEVKDK